MATTCMVVGSVWARGHYQSRCLLEVPACLHVGVVRLTAWAEEYLCIIYLRSAGALGVSSGSDWLLRSNG